MSEQKGITVLSLFDGMSCAQIALNRCGFKIDRYFASEIDKHAIKVTMANYPDTVQLGSVVDIDPATLPPIDILLGGSPCQSFSFAGKRKGMSTKCSEEIYTLERYLELKSEGYEFEGQSYLFWEYMRILKAVRPKYFFLENVEMGEKWERVLSKAIGVNGIHMNSALVSAQNRKRIYWTNIGMEPRGLFGDLESIIPQPKDKGILLKDILEDYVDEKYCLSEKMLNYFKNRAANFNNGKVNIRDEDGKATCLTSSMSSCDISDNFVRVDEKYYLKGKALKRAMENNRSRVCSPDEKSGSILANQAKQSTDMVTVKCVDIEVLGADYRTDEGLRIREGGKSITLCAGTPQPGTQKQYVVNRSVIQLNPSTESGGKQPYQQNRVYDSEGLSPALMAELSSGTHAIKHLESIRRLTPTECERLQTVPDGFTAHVSDTQRYRMLGNGWTVDVICHFLQYAKFQ